MRILLVAVCSLIGLSCTAPVESQSSTPRRPSTEDVGTSPVSPTLEPSAPAGIPFATGPWKTDFTHHSVPLTEIQSGGPPRDGIPPIDSPRFVTPEAANVWLKNIEPVVSIILNGEARAYPLQILIWHEIVNDVIGDVPVSVTFCPLCNTAIAFDRRLDDQVYDFGTTGKLRHSDLVMWDRQTESWWQQATGEAIVGTMTGRGLTWVPASIVSYADFKTSFPRGQVLSRETGFARSYGRNPYTGYDDIKASPFLFSGTTDPRLRPMERVVTVSLNDEDVAYPFSALEQRHVIMDTLGGQGIVVFYSKGTASALDRSDIADSRDVGAGVVYSAAIDGRPLNFRPADGAFADAETGSRWNILGQATGGPLAGKSLVPIVHGNHFWFAIAAFKPEIRIWSPSTR